MHISSSANKASENAICRSDISVLLFPQSHRALSIWESSAIKTESRLVYASTVRKAICKNLVAFCFSAAWKSSSLPSSCFIDFSRHAAQTPLRAPTPSSVSPSSLYITKKSSNCLPPTLAACACLSAVLKSSNSVFLTRMSRDCCAITKG